MPLLDTNHCSKILNQDPSVIRHLDSIADTVRLVTCVIVQGELIYMAERSARRDQNLRKVHSFLSDLEVLPVDPETADVFGSLKASLFTYYGPKEKAKQRRTRIEDLGFSDSDIWIAALSLRHQLPLLSADSDFKRMLPVVPLELDSWLASAPEPDDPPNL